MKSPDGAVSVMRYAEMIAVPFVFCNSSRLAVGLVVPMPTFLAAVTARALPPILRRDENKFVDDAVVENIFVVVADVPVAFTNVKFWRVVEAEPVRFANEIVPVAVRFPPM